MADFTLIENGDLFDPTPGGRGALLIGFGKVLRIGETDTAALAAAGFECEVLDAKGHFVVPGFVDPHQHLIGAGGEDGYATRTPEIQISEIVTSGITTVVGCLGTDATTRHLTTLLAKVRSLEEEGISAWMYTGAFHVPPPTLTGSVESDLVLIDKVIAAGEIAISDPRSTQPSAEELARLVSRAGVGGDLSGKAGVTHFHTGDGPRHLRILQEVLERFDVAPERLYPTHVERNPEVLADAVRLAKRGVRVDMDCIEPGIGKHIRSYLEQGGPPEQLSVSSDAHASDSAHRLYEEFVAAAREEKIPLESLLPHFTSNAATALKLPGKGRLRPGCDGDVIVLHRDSLELLHVIARGKVLLRDGKLLVRGAYEHLARAD